MSARAADGSRRERRGAAAAVGDVRAPLAPVLSAIAALVLLTAAVAASVAPAQAAGEIEAGAYCPLPKKGETPTCLEPAREEYGEFFSAVGEGKVDAESLARVEEALAAPDGSRTSYLALSSLAYGYWRLSERAAGQEEAHVEITERLEQWNAVLGRAYDASEGDETFRMALREAALDLQAQAPPVRVSCLDERGRQTRCDSTDVVVRGLDSAASDAGLRGGLRRLIERWVGSDEP